MDERLANAIIEFTAKNQGFEATVSALTSGILTPDPKMLVLLAMDREKAYSQDRLFFEVVRFSGLDVFPVTLPSVWTYCNGNSKCGGFLETIGAVKMKVEDRMCYQLTDVGELIMQPIATQALRVAEALQRIKDQKYRSMYRLFGSGGVKDPSKMNRRGYSVYAIIKELVNGNSNLTAECLSSLTEVNYYTSLNVLNALSNGRFIEYQTTGKSNDGKLPKGWSKYKLKERIGEIELRYDDLSKEEKTAISRQCSDFNRVVAYISKNPKVEHECNGVAERLGIRLDHTGSILSLLERKSYLESVTGLRAHKIQSIANPSQTTHLIWKMLLEPIGGIASALSSDLPIDKVTLLRDAMRPFHQGQEILKNEIELHRICKIIAGTYSRERSQIGHGGGEEVRNAIRYVLNRYSAMGPKEILEKTKQFGQLRRDLSPRTIFHHLKSLEERGEIEKIKKGRYKLKALTQ